MDVNQTRFHLVYGKADWYSAAAIDSPSGEPLFDWEDREATLALHQQLFVFPKRSGTVPLNVDTRRGSGRDRYGNFYWIADGRTELRFLGVSGTSEHFWTAADEAHKCPTSGDFFEPDPQALSDLVFSGLAVTPDHYLAVGLTEPAGLLVFDLHAGGTPARLRWPTNVPFAPFDMVTAPDGGVFILDRANRQYWKLDRDFRVQGVSPAAPPGAPPEAFQPVTGQEVWPPGPCEHHTITADLAASLAAISDPVAIGGLPDGSVLILENPPGAPFSVVHRFLNGVEAGQPASLERALALYVAESPSAENPFPLAVRGYDFAFVASSKPGGPLGTLYIAAISGSQSFAFDVSVAGANLQLAVEAANLPMRQFQGKGLVASDSGVFYDFQDRWVPLAEQPRPRYLQSAQLQLPLAPARSSPAFQAFDGKVPGCVWHRIFLDACIPPGSSVVIESRAADSLELLPNTPWQPEPTPYLRGDGPEIPYYKPQLTGQSGRVGTWELLFQEARGRYLQLRLTLRGTGRNTPHLHALRVYYPRFSYLRQYLPAAYREDLVSVSFLDRFLANVEGFYTVLEGKIQDVQELFDPRTIPAEYLDWLASWMSIVLDISWSESTRRMVLAHAPQMFRERGTLRGLTRAIRLMLEPCPDESLFDESCDGGSCSSSSSVFTVRLVERFLTRRAPGVVYGDPSALDAPGAIPSPTASAWTPDQGVEPLNARWRCYLLLQYNTIGALNTAWGSSYSGFEDPSLALPPVQRAGGTRGAADWQRFLRDGLGFTYAPVTANDRASYQNFLARRYKTIGDLNKAYNLLPADLLQTFDTIPLPGEMPAGGKQLQDWILFVSVALPIEQNAHQFTVLVPVSLTDTPDVQQNKLAVAESVARLEKPAHTSFDVRLYWGMFRAGEARLGKDTLLGPGSRFAALVLGNGYLAGGNLANEDPGRAHGRKPLGGRPVNQPCCDYKSQERCV